MNSSCQENGLKILRYNRKFIYLISPTRISRIFYNNLIEVLKHKKVSFFQLTKNENLKNKIMIGRKSKNMQKI